MARKRYPLAVTGSGATAVSGGNIRMTKNNWVSGDAISIGYTQNIMVDQNTAISNYTFYLRNVIFTIISSFASYWLLIFLL